MAPNPPRFNPPQVTFDIPELAQESSVAEEARMLTPELLSRLHSAAKSAQRRAYAPYSHFRVGAAILTDRGRVITGCNVENASYGLTICAERNAIARLVVEQAGTPVVCVVTGPKPEPLTPCGACRQVLLEFNPQLIVVSFGVDGSSAQWVLHELLPASFDSAALGS